MQRLIGAFSKLKNEQLGVKWQMANITATGMEVLFVVDGTRSMTRV
ncbi:MAG: hypothetical protein R2861_17290 [Desulfobacterales bacterium]